MANRIKFQAGAVALKNSPQLFLIPITQFPGLEKVYNYWLIKSKTIQKDYTIYKRFYQLKIPLNIEYIVPENDSVRLLSQVVEEMDLTELNKMHSRIKKNQATPRQMLKIMLYVKWN